VLVALPDVPLSLPRCEAQPTVAAAAALTATRARRWVSFFIEVSFCCMEGVSRSGSP
jgi:hypothetical protein